MDNPSDEVVAEAMRLQGCEGNAKTIAYVRKASHLAWCRSTLAHARTIDQRNKLVEALDGLEAKASDFIAAVDRYNEKHGEFIGGSPIFQLAKAVGDARQAITQIRSGQ